MTFTIPTWVFWLLGAVGGVAALGLMGLGVLLIVTFWNWKGPYK